MLGAQRSTAQSSWPGCLVADVASHSGEQRSCQGKQVLAMNASYIPPTPIIHMNPFKMPMIPPTSLVLPTSSSCASAIDNRALGMGRAVHFPPFVPTEVNFSVRRFRPWGPTILNKNRAVMACYPAQALSLRRTLLPNSAALASIPLPSPVCSGRVACSFLTSNRQALQLFSEETFAGLLVPLK